MQEEVPDRRPLAKPLGNHAASLSAASAGGMGKFGPQPIGPSRGGGGAQQPTSLNKQRESADSSGEDDEDEDEEDEDDESHLKPPEG